MIKDQKFKDYFLSVGLNADYHDHQDFSCYIKKSKTIF